MNRSDTIDHLKVIALFIALSFAPIATARVLDVADRMRRRCRKRSA